jgi:hypothetical protein
MPVDPDQFQWLWDGINNFRIKFNRRPFDVAQHGVNCKVKSSETSMPCTCCKGALTFEEALLVKEMLTGVRAKPNPKVLEFKSVPATICWGIENCKELFGLGNSKESITAAFEAGTCDNKNNHTAREGDAPQSVVSDQGRCVLWNIDPEAPLVVDEDGTIAGEVDPWHDEDVDSCASCFTGSSSRSEWEIEHDDFGNWDWFMLVARINDASRGPVRRQSICIVLPQKGLLGMCWPADGQPSRPARGAGAATVPQHDRRLPARCPLPASAERCVRPSSPQPAACLPALPASLPCRRRARQLGGCICRCTHELGSADARA